MPLVLAMTDKLSPRMIGMIEDLCTDWRYLDERIKTVSDEIATLSEQDEGAKRLMTVPGIGPIISLQQLPRLAGRCVLQGQRFRRMARSGAATDVDRRAHGPRVDLQAQQSVFTDAVRAGANAVLLHSQSWEKHGLKSWIEAAARRLNRFKLAIAIAN
jgi:transposase